MKKRLIIIISIIIIVIFIIVLFLSNRASKAPKLDGYLDGTRVNTSDKLKSSHCIDDICISNVHIYYLDGKGNIEYKIKNNGNNKKGYLNMVFGRCKILVIYDFSDSDEYSGISQFDGYNLSRVKDYKLVRLTKEEETSIIK